MPSDKSPCWTVAGYLVAAVAILFCARYLDFNVKSFLPAISRIAPQEIAVALTMFTASLVLNAIAFAHLGHAFGFSTSVRLSAAVWASSLLAKYIPVGVGHVLGRGVILSRHGVSWRSITYTGVIEQVCSLALCVFIATLMMLAVNRGGMYASAFVGVGSVAVVLYIVLLGVLFPMVNRRYAISSLALYGAAMVPFAFGHIVLIGPNSIVAFVAALFAGTAAGIAAIFVPGGLGIREAAVGAAADAGDSAALLAGLLAARGMIITSEVFGSLIGAWVQRWRR